MRTWKTILGKISPSGKGLQMIKLNTPTYPSHTHTIALFQRNIIKHCPTNTILEELVRGDRPQNCKSQGFYTRGKMLPSLPEQGVEKPYHPIPGSYIGNTIKINVSRKDMNSIFLFRIQKNHHGLGSLTPWKGNTFGEENLSSYSTMWWVKIQRLKIGLWETFCLQSHITFLRKLTCRELP